MTDQEIKKEFDIVTSKDFPWFYHEYTTDQEDNKNPTVLSEKTLDDIMFVHTCYQDSIPNSQWYPRLLFPFYKFCESEKIKQRAVLRVKLNLTTSNSSDLPAPAHIDYPYPHKVFLYYYNDSDGDTILYNEFFNESEPEELTEKMRISPKAGSAIMFDGLNYHSPSPPKNSRIRVVLNVAFV